MTDISVFDGESEKWLSAVSEIRKSTKKLERTEFLSKYFVKSTNRLIELIQGRILDNSKNTVAGARDTAMRGEV